MQTCVLARVPPECAWAVRCDEWVSSMRTARGRSDQSTEEQLVTLMREEATHIPEIVERIQELMTPLRSRQRPASSAVAAPSSSSLGDRSRPTGGSTAQRRFPVSEAATACMEQLLARYSVDATSACAALPLVQSLSSLVHSRARLWTNPADSVRDEDRILAHLARIAIRANQKEVTCRHERNRDETMVDVDSSDLLPASMRRVASLPLLGPLVSVLVQPILAPPDDAAKDEPRHTQRMVFSAEGFASLIVECVHMRAAVSLPTDSAPGSATILDDFENGILELMTRPTIPLTTQQHWYKRLRRAISSLDRGSLTLDSISPLLRLASAALTRVFPASTECPGLHWPSCFTMTPAPPVTGGARAQAEALLVNAESRTTTTVDLVGVCALAVDTLHLIEDAHATREQHSHASEIVDRLQTRLISLARCLFDPTQVSRWLCEGAPLEHGPVPTAAVATLLAPLYDMWTDIIVRRTKQRRSNDDENLFVTSKRSPISAPRASTTTSTTATRATTSPFLATLFSELFASWPTGRDAFVHPNSHSMPLACCTGASKLPLTQLHSTFVDAANFAPLSVACIAMEAAAMMRHARQKSIDKKRLTPLDLENLPSCLRLPPTSTLSLEVAAECLRDVVRNRQAINARLIDPTWSAVRYPTWTSMPATTDILRTVRAAVAARDHDPSSLPSSSTSTSALLALTEQLLAAMLPTLAKQRDQTVSHFRECMSGLPAQSVSCFVLSEAFRRHLAPTDSSDATLEPPIDLHVHALPWIRRVQESAAQRPNASVLSEYRTKDQHLRAFAGPLKVELLHLMQTLATSALQADEATQQRTIAEILPQWNNRRHSYANATSTTHFTSSAPPPSPTLASVLSVLTASYLWRELLLGVDEPCIVAYMQLLDAVTPPRADDTVSLLPSSSRASAFDAALSGPFVDIGHLLALETSGSVLACTLVQRTLATWPIEPLSLYQRCHQFLLARMPLLTVEVEEEEGIDPDAQEELPLLDSSAMELTASSMQTSLSVVHASLEKYRATSQLESGLDQVAPSPSTEADHVESSSSPTESTTKTPLPTWRPANAVSYALDDDPADAEADDPDFYLSERESLAKVSDARRRFETEVAPAIVTMKMHTTFILRTCVERAARIARRTRIVREQSDRLAAAARRSQAAEKASLESVESARRAAARVDAAEARAAEFAMRRLTGPPSKTRLEWDEQRERLRRLNQIEDQHPPEQEERDAESPVAIEEQMNESTHGATSLSPLPSILSSSAIPADRPEQDHRLILFMVDLLLSAIGPSAPEDAEMQDGEGSSPNQVDSLEVGCQWSSLLSLLPQSSSKRARRAPSQSTSSTPQLRSTREVVSNVMRIIDACMDACEKEVALCEAMVHLCTTRTQQPAPDATSRNDVDLTLLALVHAFCALDATLPHLIHLHRLYPDESIDAFSSLVLSLRQAVSTAREWIDTLAQTHEHDENAHQLRTYSESLHSSLEPHLSAVLAHNLPSAPGTGAKRRRPAAEDGESTNLSPRSSPRPSPTRRRPRAPASGASGTARSGGRRRAHAYADPHLSQLSREDAQLPEPGCDTDSYEDLDGFIVADDVE